MSKKFYATRPFKFESPGVAAVTNPTTGKVTPAVAGFSREFTIGEHDMPPEMEEHPWIQAGADGAIETEEEAKDRKIEEDANKVVAEAQAKMVADKHARVLAKQDALAKKAAEDNRAATTHDADVKRQDAVKKSA